MGMELVGQMYGFMLYISEHQPIKSMSTLSITKVHDRAQVFIACSGTARTPIFVGVIERWSNTKLILPKLSCESRVKLLILVLLSCNQRLYEVENLGRINYGPYLYDRKGILSSVFLDGIVLKKWKMFPLTFSDIDKVLSANPLIQLAESKGGYA